MNEEASYSWRAKDGSRIRVSVEPSFAHANVCRFTVDPLVYPGGAVYVDARENTAYSPLAQTIFGLGDVTEVLIAGESVTVTTKQVPDWQDLGSKVAAAIRQQIDSGIPGVSDEHKKNLLPTAAIREKVQTLIDTAIAPAVASHGGSVILLDVKDNNVYLEFGGGCKGCGMAHVTLKHGVERLCEPIPR